jgi:hypothetical protein
MSFATGWELSSDSFNCGSSMRRKRYEIDCIFANLIDWSKMISKQIWFSSQVFNATFTMSHFEYTLLDLSSLQTTIIIYDGIIHTPQRDVWKWDSPVVGRIGFLKFSFNLLSLLDLPTWLKTTFSIYINPIKDIYAVEARDVQIFIEKRRNVFNFHLLDPSLDLPSPQEVLESIKAATNVDMNTESNESKVSNLTRSRNTISRTDSIVKQDEDEKKAKEFILGIVDAVESLGRAANEGGTAALSHALRNQKDGLVNHLKKVQNMVDVSGDGKLDQDKTKSIGIAKEGLHVMKHVGKVVEKNVLIMKEQVDALSKPPPKKSDWDSSKSTDMFRIGHINIDDIWIFTKDILVVTGSPHNSSNHTSLTKADMKTRQDINPSGWSKPIFIERVLLRSHELCPSDENRIGQPIEDILDIVLEKAFNEMAKSTAGKLLRNVFSDVFSFFQTEDTKHT